MKKYKPEGTVHLTQEQIHTCAKEGFALRKNIEEQTKAMTFYSSTIDDIVKKAKKEERDAIAKIVRDVDFKIHDIKSCCEHEKRPIADYGTALRIVECIAAQIKKRDQ